MKKIIIGIGIGILVLFLYFGVSIYQFFNAVDKLGVCGLQVGPYYGKQMVLQSDINQVDTLIHLSSGKLAFLHTQDSLVPIIGKLDSNNTWNWAVELSPSDSTSWVPLKAMSGIKLVARNGANEIHFF